MGEKKMKKALVTGAAGFIGSHVVEELLKENVDVRALVRPGEDIRNIESFDIEIVTGDILDVAAVDKAMQGVDTVFHLAAVFSIWMKNWAGIYEVNMQGSRNVLQSALDNGVGRVVYTSSIAALGISPGKGLSDEDTPFNQYDLGSHYVLTKYLSQQEALAFARKGLDLVVVNPCFPFGANDIGPTPTGGIIVDILKGYNWFYYAGGLNIVDVRDVARGHVLAAQKGETGRKYILGNCNLTMKEFMRLVYRVSEKKIKVMIPVPLFVLYPFAGFLTWVADRFTHRPPMTTPVEVRYSKQYLFFDNTRAKNELGLEFTPLEDSLHRSIAWFRENGYV
ncbi:MAG: SDR family oxidoreductase [Thermodesulfobacteriota bacterium]|nr:SDR family oxidoreductase [Thermodesulfobacteriota bacterium]